ncbi:MAG TPA: hypothetical protein VHY08_06320 [Bacillota bacterium]|nr:hypothetical protein [Bacillota bacterium]
MSQLRIFLITALLIFLIPAVALAGGWKTLKTEHFTVFYSDGFETEAWGALEILEYYRPEVEKISGNEAAHLSVVIDDTGTLVNGFSNPIAKQIHLFKYPPQGGWAAAENWWSLVGVHEYTHHLTLSKTGGVPGFIAKIIGNNLLLFPLPNFVTPGWVIEGITVYNESQLSPFQGRLNDGLFDAYIGSRVQDDRLPSIVDATFDQWEYQMSGIYTYGGEFIDFLAKNYGQEKVTRFFEVNGSNLGSLTPFPSIGIDKSVREVFGKSFPQLWKEWQDSEKDRFQDFKMEGEQLTHNGWELTDLKAGNGKLYYQHSYPVKTGSYRNYVFNEIRERELATGAERVIVSTTSPFSLPMQVKDGVLYYTVNEIRPGYANATMQSYGYYSKLHQYDLATGKDRVLLGDELRAFTMLNDGKILYSKDRKGGFGSELYLFSQASGEKSLLMTSDYLVDEIVSDSKRILVAARQDWNNLNLYQFQLQTQEFVSLAPTYYQQNRLSLQGEKLFFTANYAQEYSAYCYDFESGQVYRLTENGYASNPVYDEAAGQLYFIGLNSYGYDLYRKPAQFTEFKEFIVPEEPEATFPPALDLNKDTVKEGGYWDNLKTMAPSFRVPVINVDANRSEYGVYIEGQDAIGHFPYYDATLTYDTKQEKMNVSADLMGSFLAPLNTMISYTNVGESSLTLDLSYPFIKRVEPGISDLSLGTKLVYEEDYLGPALEPFMTFGYQTPRTNFSLNCSVPQAQLQDGTQRSGLYAGLVINQFLSGNESTSGSEMSLKFQSINDPDNPDLVFPLIRGYLEPLDAKQGEIYTLEYSRPIAQLRDGVWALSFYVEDISLKLFADWAKSWEGASQGSWGAELHLENKLFAIGLPLDWGLICSWNQEGKNSVGLSAGLAM